MLASIEKRIHHLTTMLDDQAVVVLPGASHIYRNMDVDFPFRQFSDFAYLTEWHYPDAWWILRKKGDQAEAVLCCQDADPVTERWEGRRLTPEAIVGLGHAETVIYQSELINTLSQWLQDTNTLYYPFERQVTIDVLLKSVLDHSKRRPSKPHIYKDLSQILGRMRLIKSDEEITLMKHACQISSQAHVALMAQTASKDYEYQLSSIFRDACYQLGAEHLAYESIVASGENASILHYRTCRDPIDTKGLILVDAGCEWQGYASDITRTFPASGKFSPQQRDIYTVVLNTQQAIIDAIKPGLAFNELHQIAIKAMSDGVSDLGLLSSTPYGLNDLFFHGVSHWLGRDVHDPCPYVNDEKASMILKPGMVLTVEPGLYLSNELKALDPLYHSISVRIEDDVVVTDAGCDVLSQDCPKTIDAIEDIMSI